MSWQCGCNEIKCKYMIRFLLENLARSTTNGYHDNNQTCAYMWYYVLACFTGWFHCVWNQLTDKRCQMYTWVQVRNVRLNEIVLQYCATRQNPFYPLEMYYNICRSIGASIYKMQTLVRMQFIFAGVHFQTICDKLLLLNGSMEQHILHVKKTIISGRYGTKHDVMTETGSA